MDADHGGGELMRCQSLEPQESIGQQVTHGYNTETGQQACDKFHSTRKYLVCSMSR